MFESGQQALADVLDGDDAALPILFEERVREWPHPARHEELFTVGLFSDLESALSPTRAFVLLGPATQIAVEVRASEHLDCALCLPSGLARQSGTTELPPALADAWPVIETAVESKDLTQSVEWGSLRRWYRR